MEKLTYKEIEALQLLLQQEQARHGLTKLDEAMLYQKLERMRHEAGVELARGR